MNGPHPLSKVLSVLLIPLTLLFFLKTYLFVLVGAHGHLRLRYLDTLDILLLLYGLALLSAPIMLVVVFSEDPESSATAGLRLTLKILFPMLITPAVLVILMTYTFNIFFYNQVEMPLILTFIFCTIDFFPCLAGLIYFRYILLFRFVGSGNSEQAPKS